MSHPIPFRILAAAILLCGPAPLASAADRTPPRQPNMMLNVADDPGASAASGRAEVKVEETTVALPTYLPGPCDKNPIFYTGRVYQGAQGRVYPYPLQDVLHDEKVEKTYTSLRLENEYLEMSLLPEIGGRLFSFTDKDSGFEIFYRQSVIKPALIGMLGAWTSGGVEWNFPHHHRATTFMPVDYALAENADGSKTIWIGETELRHRMKWSIGLTMHPGRSYLEADCLFMNRRPYIESMLYWANVSVHCGPDYQVIFPPSCRVGMDHHKSYFTRFPMGRPNVAIDEIADLSWWKNFTSDHRSIFAVDPDNDFLAGYDHGKQMGTVHVANRQIVCGKKFFLWGNNPGGFVWDKVLTDHDGPYLELMVGAYSDNQPDYSWISPYETRRCKQYWYPIKRIGGVKCATLDAAVNLERRAPGMVFLGFNATARFERAKAVLKHGAETFSEIIDIDPNTPYVKEIPIAAAVKDEEITGILFAPDGRELVRYTPVVVEDRPLPEPVENPKPPGEYKSMEELYLVGLRLEQFHNGIVDPPAVLRRGAAARPDGPAREHGCRHPPGAAGAFFRGGEASALRGGAHDAQLHPGQGRRAALLPGPCSERAGPATGGRGRTLEGGLARRLPTCRLSGAGGDRLSQTRLPGRAGDGRKRARSGRAFLQGAHAESVRSPQTRKAEGGGGVARQGRSARSARRLVDRGAVFP
jgi:hypothetical protein